MEWISVDENAGLVGLHNEKIEGVTVRVGMSPYDLPLAVRGFRNPVEKSFGVEFRYATSEPIERRKVKDGIVIDLGTRSGRLYKLTITADRSCPTHLDLEIIKAFETSYSTFQRENKRVFRKSPEPNFGVTQKVFERNKSIIVPQLQMV